MCLSVCPRPRGLACRGSRMGLGARAGCAAPAPTPLPLPPPEPLPPSCPDSRGSVRGGKVPRRGRQSLPGAWCLCSRGATSDFPHAHFPVCPKGPSSAQAASGCEATGSWQAQAGAVGAQLGGGGGCVVTPPRAEARREEIRAVPCREQACPALPGEGAAGLTQAAAAHTATVEVLQTGIRRGPRRPTPWRCLA